MPAETHTDHRGADQKGADAKAPARTPAPAKRPKLDEEVPAPEAVPATQQKTLPTGLSRAIVIATVIFSVAYAGVSFFADRYVLSPVPNSANSFVYRLDRLTGSIEFCGSQSCSAVRTRAAE